MKKYYTLIQSLYPEKKDLKDYLDEQGIEYSVGADFAEEFSKANNTKTSVKDGTLMVKYTVLIEEHELSAILLSVDGVEIVNNRDDVNFRNKVRGYFSWVLD